MFMNQLKIAVALVLIGGAAACTAGLAWALGPQARPQIAAAPPHVTAPPAKTATAPRRRRAGKSRSTEWSLTRLGGRSPACRSRLRPTPTREIRCDDGRGPDRSPSRSDASN